MVGLVCTCLVLIVLCGVGVGVCVSWLLECTCAVLEMSAVAGGNLQVAATVYLVLVFIIFSVCLRLQMHPDFSLPSWRLRRTLAFGSVLVFGFVPVTHWVALNQNSAAMVGLFLPRVGVAYGLIGLGFAFYSSHFPERFFPGTACTVLCCLVCIDCDCGVRVVCDGHLCRCLVVLLCN